MTIKIAPTLQRFVDDPGTIGPDDTDAMVREARAVLAVCRAAGAVARCGEDAFTLDLPADYWGPMQRLHAARSRLRKLSAPRSPSRNRRSRDA